ncbi:MAG: tetratricopeptide repeat protein [Verrucomicrobia bacterium]|nr:tetratricopeptide repeat protein [Verrucomicrobiota bacterium]
MGWKPIKQRRAARSDSQAQSRADAGVTESRGHAAAGCGGYGGSRLPPSPGPPSSRQPGRFRGWRGWLLRGALLVLSPLVFFGLLEGGLRLGGYGYPTGFFVRSEAGGGDKTNSRFAWRCFPPSLARTPQPARLLPKPKDTVRIYLLGSSAAMGIPQPSYGFGRILEVMLRACYPGQPFEVVNAAMTAINSHVVREIARDCAAHEPSLFVIYTGNNEVIGPYGPGTVFQRWSPSLRLVRANLRVKSTRVGQLLGNVLGAFRRDAGTPTQWRGMEMFQNNPVTADDPRLTVVYANLRQNLTDICRLARRAGAPVILSTVAVNQRDCPPLASRHRPGLTPADLARWQAIYQEGVDLEARSLWREAVARYEAAASLDERFADLQFRLGRCLVAAGRGAEAGERFGLARDLDVLRFRADTRINALIREVAAAQKATGVHLADAEQALARSALSPDGIPGQELFYEHVHLTFDGNYLLAQTVLEQVATALPELALARGQGAIPSRQQCAAALALTAFDEYKMAATMESMTSQQPFTEQMDHARYQAAAHQRAESLKQLALTQPAMQTAWQTYTAALAATPDDWRLHEGFAMLASACGRPDVAVTQLRTVLKQVPWVAEAHSNLGAMLADRGQVDEALTHYQQALAIQPNLAEAHYNFGNALAGRGRIEEAMVHYQKALDTNPDDADYHHNLGTLQAGRGRHDEAMSHFQAAVALRPGEARFHHSLAAALAERGRLDPAIAEYQKLLEIAPDSAETHYQLGVVLAGCGRVDEAIVHYQQALKIKPDYTQARRNLEAVEAARSSGK